MNYRWLLFDLDNTLYDFDAASHFALHQTLEEYGVDPSSGNKEVYYDINHSCWTAFENGAMDFKTLRNKRFELFVNEIGVNADASGMGNRYLKLLSETDFKIEGAMPLLDHLEPNYNLVVVTNGLKEVKRPQLSKPEISKYFKAIIISEEIGIAKPHEGFFDHTFNTIGSPDKSDVIIIGDNLNSDIRGGQDYGIDTCWFNPNQKNNATDVKPTFEIDTLDQLLKIV